MGETGDNANASLSILTSSQTTFTQPFSFLLLKYKFCFCDGSVVCIHLFVSQCRKRTNELIGTRASLVFVFAHGSRRKSNDASFAGFFDSFGTI